MDYKHDFITALVDAKEQGIGAVLAFLMAVLRGKYQGSLFWKTVIDALMCAMIAWFIRDILDFVGLRHDLGYVASVFIGYVGTDFIGMGIKRLIGSRVGVSNENQ